MSGEFSLSLYLYLYPLSLAQGSGGGGGDPQPNAHKPAEVWTLPPLGFIGYPVQLIEPLSLE